MITTIVDQYGFIGAAFTDPVKAADILSRLVDFDKKVDRWHESNDQQALHEALGLSKEEYKHWVEDPRQYHIEHVEHSYPLFYIWQWDHTAPEDKSKWKVETISEAELDKFIKSYKRDFAVEQLPTWDDQYFYLGVVYRDGVSYGIQKQLGMLKGNRLHEGLSGLYDHHHMDWSAICYFKSVGVRYATMLWKQQIAYRKLRHLGRKTSSLTKLEKLGQISAAGKKKLKRLQAKGKAYAAKNHLSFT